MRGMLWLTLRFLIGSNSSSLEIDNSRNIFRFPFDTVSTPPPSCSLSSARAEATAGASDVFVIDDPPAGGTTIRFATRLGAAFFFGAADGSESTDDWRR